MTQFSCQSGSVSFWLAIAMVCCSLSNGGKILVVPLEGSHWINMDILIQALHGRGHTIDVIRTLNSWFVKENSTYYSSITIPNTKGMDEEFVKDMLSRMISQNRGQGNWLTAIYLFLDVFRATAQTHKMQCQLIRNTFESEEIMKFLTEKQYDLVLTDPVWGAGIFLAHKLQIPMVYNVRWTATGEGHFETTPSPLSYIPLVGTGNTDRMTFAQKIKNVFFYMLNSFQNYASYVPQYQELCDKYFSPRVHFSDLLRRADIWLMRVDFVFEFPRPTMPNIVYIGGFQCKPAKALPKDLENFMQSSGENGVIIMSLGTFVSDLPHDITEQIAAAFAQLPQKVIWRYTGKIPATLGNNTLLVDWMPQNDLLGHPKTKAFVAHGGTNGVQEALYHGIPVLGIPLFFDQYDNLLRVQEKGGAKIVLIDQLEKNVFYEVLLEIINEPSYRRNMQRLSHLHRDKPVKPMDSALFWIEFVMRHKGAPHLRTESYMMPWYSYYSIDVGLTLLAMFSVVLFLIFVAVRRLCIMVFCRRKQKSQ